MNTLTYREIVTGMAAFGFAAGWIVGAFLSLWAYSTLFLFR